MRLCSRALKGEGIQALVSADSVSHHIALRMRSDEKASDKLDQDPRPSWRQIGDAWAADSNQLDSDGFPLPRQMYNVEARVPSIRVRLVKRRVACGSTMERYGMKDDLILEGVFESTLASRPISA